MENLIYIQKLGLLNSKKNRLLDIGPQNVYNCKKEQILQFISGHGGISKNKIDSAEIDRLVYFSTPRKDERTTLLSEITDLTNIEYNSFDVCPALKTELLDLNFDKLPEKYSNYYDIVINFGTTEHIFNQWNCFSVIHSATKVGGSMYHILPATGYFDHGYYCYTPLFFRDLAKSNNYEIIDIFLVPVGADKIELDMRHEPTFERPGPASKKRPNQSIPAYNIHVIFRKLDEKPFYATLEVATAHAAVDEKMLARYGDASALGQNPGTGGESGITGNDLIDNLRSLIDTLRSERDHLQRESDMRMRERDEKTAEINRKEIQLQARILESEARMRERDEKSAEIARKEAQLQARILESEARMRERDEKSAEIAIKEAQLQARILESEARMRERDEKSAEIAVKEAQLRAIYRSTSWGVTKPIRAFGRLFRKKH
jgi:hypothetical protein